MKPHKSLVSIVIVGWNHWLTLERCLVSVFSQNYSFIEVLYIDNASADKSVDAIAERFPGVHVIANVENFGFAKACNQGIAASNGRYVFILNPDTILEKNSIDELISVCELDGKVGICGPKVLMMQNPNRINSVGMAFDRHGRCHHIGDGEIDNGQYDTIVHVPMIAGAAMFCKKEMLTEIGGFDEDYFAYHEDAELCLRAWWMGWKCLNIPRAIVYHVRNSGSKNSAIFAETARYYEHRNRYWNILLYTPFILLVPKIFLILFSEIPIVLRQFFRWAKLRTMPIELSARLAGTMKILNLLRKRGRISRQRKIPYVQLKDLLSPLGSQQLS